MCGITGIYSLTGRRIANLRERIEYMTNFLVHRGPDGLGIFVDPNRKFALGNTRLAISDPSSDLQQPFRDDIQESVLTFNGEIYNDKELRKNLVLSGSAFRSNQDTEVLLVGMNLEGESFLDKVDGMWAFAFYNGIDKSLLLSRDLLGERQLFYRVSETEIVFASEIPPLLADSEAKLQLDYRQIFHSLQFGAPESGHTLVENVSKLQAGYSLRAYPDGRVSEYRRALLNPEKWFDYFNTQPHLESVTERFNDIFLGSCLKRVPQEVPFISTLSGGLDSTLVSINASKFGKDKIDTLFGWSSSIGSEQCQLEMSEREASAFTSKFINSEHYEVQLDTEESIGVLEGVASNSYDGMLEEGTAPFEMLARYGKRLGKKVMLLSDGPDELLGGYSHDAEQLARNRTWGQQGDFEFIPNHQTSDPTIMNQMFEYDRTKDTKVGFGKIHPDYFPIANDMGPSQLMALSYASYSIPDYNNLRADRGFMRASVESRSPFLSPQMVEFMVAMPGNLRFGNGTSTKWIMRQIISDILGDKIANRSKHGFSRPLWFTPRILKALHFEEIINTSPLLNLLPFSKKFLDDPFAPPFHKIRWSIYSLTKIHENLTNCRF